MNASHLARRKPKTIRAFKAALRVELLEDRTLLNFGPVQIPANAVPITWFGQKAFALSGQWVLDGQFLTQPPADVTYSQLRALERLPGYKYFEPNFFDPNTLLDTIP